MLEILWKQPAVMTDPAFYVNDGDPETVAIAYGKYEIVRCGEMRAEYEAPTRRVTIRTTADLLDHAIDSDEALAKLENNGLFWENNAWFEVWYRTEDDEIQYVTDEAFFSIQEAYDWISNQLKITPFPIYDRFAWQAEGRKQEREEIIEQLRQVRRERKSAIDPRTASIEDVERYKAWVTGLLDAIVVIDGRDK